MTERYITLAGDFRISRVITGLWQIADIERKQGLLDPYKTANFMDAYVDAGFTSFDMADHYGSAELIAGAFRHQSPNGAKAQMLTKWVPTPGNLSKEQTRAAIQLALKRLQSERLDMLQYHAWNYIDPSWLDQLYWLSELQEEGLIGLLGLANFDAAHLRIVCSSGIKIATNQVCHSLIDRRAESDLAAVCREFGVKVLAFGTLAGGFLSDKWLGQSEPLVTEAATWSQMKYKRFIDQGGGWEAFQRLMACLSTIALRHDQTIANVATKYILQKDYVAAVIIGARLGQNSHISDNQRLFSFALNDQDLNEILAAQHTLSAIPGDCGDEYRKPPFLTASGDLSHHLDEMPLPYQPIEKSTGRHLILSGTSWETLAGYSRAVRHGDRISVSGTTATHGHRVIGHQDITAQTSFVLDKIEGAIVSLGGRLEDVVRTRIFIRNVNEWEPVARVHGQRFAHIQPANTLVQANLVGEDYLVEIEAEAVVGC